MAPARPRFAPGEPVEPRLVERLLPHRYPMLLVDRVVTWQPGVSLHAVKAVTLGEPFFRGHFPGAPIMPGVLVIEALAQATGLLAALSGHFNPATDAMAFTGIESARFRQPVLPGVLLDLRVQVTKHRGAFWWADATAQVNGVTAVEAKLSAAIGPAKP